jgi:type IV pilus assembly protein PilC
VGEIFKNLAIEHFTSEMATLVESGVPILYSLEIAERSASNAIMQDAIRKIKENVRDGKLLAEPLEKCGLFPPMVVQMVSIGEEIGELSKMFSRLAIYYGQTVETFITRFASIFEPILLVFVGLIIGFLVISMFLPIFSIASINTG